jgi:hypothetical protein
MQHNPNDYQQRSEAMPDPYDRQLGMLHDLPDVVKTKPSTVRTMPLLGVGGAQVFIVQTYRQREKGDTIFLEVMSAAGQVRLVIPPQVANVVARQRDALTHKVRSKVAQAAAQDMKERGIQPGFMRKKEKK